MGLRTLSHAGHTVGAWQIYGRSNTRALGSGRDEGIVCAPSNRGRTRSSDLHEWRNDLATVSTRDPANIALRVKMLVSRIRTERPRGPLLQLDVGFRYGLCRIGGSQGSRGVSFGGGNLEIPPSSYWGSNRDPLSGSGTASGGQFDWGGRLPKSNGGAQRFPQPGWPSGVECKGTRELHCETNKSSRCESRA